MFDTDEHVRGDASIEGMAQAEGGVHQGERHRHRRQRVGHQRCGGGRRADGKAAVAEKKGLKPMARLVAYGHAGIDPEDHGPRPGHRR